MTGPARARHAVFIDPSYVEYYGDKLFDVSDARLNRDDCLSPYDRLRSHLSTREITVRTADFLFRGEGVAEVNHYYSFGLLDNYARLKKRNDVRLRGFIVFEPPIVAPNLYRVLPALTANFERVYVHNSDGDGYSLDGIDRSRLRKLYWPQPRDDVIVRWWSNRERLQRVVAISGNHIPRSFSGELYSKRIEAMAALARFKVVDLYGRGWSRWWSYYSMWPPYWTNYRALRSIYRGPCASKYEVLGRYEFSLCLENMAMKGWLTEKLFDCLYTGTIPLYLGATDIAELVPRDAFVDCRQFTSWDEMWRYAQALPVSRRQFMREAGRAFIRSNEGLRYYNSLIELFSL
jgi:alpha(1,3/1,4) fucosyltransferase